VRVGVERSGSRVEEGACGTLLGPETTPVTGCCSRVRHRVSAPACPDGQVDRLGVVVTWCGGCLVGV
jgi:hypothetical protein